MVAILDNERERSSNLLRADGGNCPLEPRKQTLAELFEGHLVYTVPNYQRLYVWTREGQWEPLWSDVSEIAERLLKDALLAGLQNVDPDTTESHFLGAVVLKISGSTPDLARQMRVIDGQQRLTTLQILVAAAINALEELEINAPAGRLRQLTLNSSSSVEPGTHSHKINHHRHVRGHDYERFGDVMTAALEGGDTLGNIDGPMAECYKYFQTSVYDWLIARNENTSMAAAALATTLILKLHVVGIYLETHEKEHIIFETLNARGEPLTEWDKIKNYLLYKADEEPQVDQERFFETYLDRFDDPWWRKEVGRGAQRPRTDIFSDYWLESKRLSPVAVRRVFREFQRFVDNENQPLEAIMQELVEDARHFEQFEKGEDIQLSREALFHRRRLELSIGAIWPLLLQLQRLHVDGTERERWFSILESYFVRRMIAGFQARSYDQVALDLLNALHSRHDNQQDTTATILNHLLNYSETATLWPSDAQVKQAILDRHLAQYAQKLVLSAIESHLITDRAGIPQLAPNIQVEHLMPRGWHRVSWPLPTSVDPGLAVEERERAIGTLGNLTLLNGRLNASISNGPWQDKKNAIQESDNLFLNRRLLQESGEEWTEEDIYNRGEWLYRMVIEVWPRG